MTSFAVKFLGCKVSQADAMLARGALLAAGHTEAPEADAELHVINTCCITSEAEAKSRQSVRRSLKTAREVYVAGCAVNLNAGQFAEIDQHVKPFVGTADDVATQLGRMRGPGARRARPSTSRAGDANARIHQGPGRLRLPLRVLHHPDRPGLGALAAGRRRAR